MTDFLTALAARTLGQPALQPRVLSRFEPERRGEPLLPAEETEYVRTGAPVAPPPAARPAPRQVLDAAVQPPMQESITHAVSPVETPATRRIEVHETPRKAEPRTVESPRKEVVVTTPPRVDVREHTTVVEVPVVQREREIITETQEKERPSRSSAQAGLPVLHERTVVQREVRSRYEEAPPVIVETAAHSEPPSFFREERLTRATTTRRTRELRRAMHRDAQPAAATPPPPEIHVSIGRVEVRATTAPAAGKRRRDEPRVMTIDDYVAHRARKERP